MVGLAFAVVLCMGGGLGYAINALVIRRRRTHCPSCCANALETYDFIRATEVDRAGKRFPSWWTKHRCAECGALFVRYRNGGLITREAFEAGARIALPEATVVRDHT